MWLSCTNNRSAGSNIGTTIPIMSMQQLKPRARGLTTMPRANKTCRAGGFCLNPNEFCARLKIGAFGASREP